MLRLPKISGSVIKIAFYQTIHKQAQRRAAMDRRMHCIIPNESYNINHNCIAVLNTLYIFMT